MGEQTDKETEILKVGDPEGGFMINVSRRGRHLTVAISDRPNENVCIVEIDFGSEETKVNWDYVV